ncbi:hypothetical protein MesoLj131b_32500 [Mesorhizobium sp. 131-2-5]|uniref:hypothetical protein n=1 Tax=Mesorhizobium sp. 131-2-5 TaxID=2744519 RepID=UPI001927238D|nr:hypothetical protein [Mesorhizobium sp. 131-2-5]BCH01251.1 hypothetical protein MesoLj131b_32500 [Mesorhizobium sp. 131-2-5]
MLADTDPIDTESQAAAPAKGGGKARLVTFDDLDKRTKAAQQAIEFRDLLISERGGDDLGALRMAIIEDVACVSAMIRDAQVRWLKGEQISLTELATLLNCRRRDAELIGLDPTPRDITPDIATFMATRAAEKASKAA